MNDKKITFTYLNIRESIVILLARLIILDLVIATIIIGLYFIAVQSEDFWNVTIIDKWLFLIVFGTLGLFKIFVGVFTILQWLTEYYELTPEYIVHRWGIIFKKSEHYHINSIRRMEIKDTFLGEIFNFATLILYDTRLNKTLDLYQIHNPQRYAHVLKELRPEIETKTDHTALPFLPAEEEL